MPRTWGALVLLVRHRKQGARGNLNSTPTDKMGELLIAQWSSFPFMNIELVELNRQVRTINQSINSRLVVPRIPPSTTDSLTERIWRRFTEISWKPRRALAHSVTKINKFVDFDKLSPRCFSFQENPSGAPLGSRKSRTYLIDSRFMFWWAEAYVFFFFLTFHSFTAA